MNNEIKRLDVKFHNNKTIQKLVKEVNFFNFLGMFFVNGTHVKIDHNISNRIVVKDNHRPCIPTPVDVNLSLPQNTGDISCEKTNNVCGVPTGPPSVHWQSAQNAKQC